MAEEQDIVRQLVTQFPYLRDKVAVRRVRRIFADVTVVNLPDVFDYAVREMGFEILCMITGLDQGLTLGVIYHLSRQSGVVLNIATSVHKIAPVLKTVTPYFSSADIYEREMADLLGIEVHGLPPGSRYPLPDDWPKEVFPLRKDWNLKMLLKKEAGKNAQK